MIGAAWVHFANTGVPTHDWPVYNNATDSQPILEPGEWKVEQDSRMEHCDFWTNFCDDDFCVTNETDPRALLGSALVGMPLVKTASIWLPLVLPWHKDMSPRCAMRDCAADARRGRDQNR